MNQFAKVALLLLTATACHGSPSLVRTIAAPFSSSGVSPLGVVTPTTRCGGVGTQRQLRISDCEGFCELQPGKVYNCENDFIPSSPSESLSLMVEVCTNAGFCIVILQVELPNSSVQPGFLYTAKYSIVPNDILTGQTVTFKASLYQTRGSLVEICVSSLIKIL
ncbi:uncharacterized protein LOC110863425 [Folsomia candida]|nr:uncharacterized protein LOC110863425 [Folsomia candida]